MDDVARAIYDVVSGDASWWEAEAGSATDFGRWYALILLNPQAVDWLVEQAAESGIDPGRIREELRGIKAMVISIDDHGFREIEYFTSRTRARQYWRAVEEWQEKFYSESEDE